MAKTVTLKSGVTVVWGIIDGHKQTDIGTVQSVKKSSGSKTKEYPDETGEAAVFVQYDKADTYTLEILAKASATVPAVGATLTIETSVKLLVLTAEQNWMAEDCQKITVTARGFANITLA